MHSSIPSRICSLGDPGEGSAQWFSNLDVNNKHTPWTLLIVPVPEPSSPQISFLDSLAGFHLPSLYWIKYDCEIYILIEQPWAEQPCRAH